MTTLLQRRLGLLFGLAFWLYTVLFLGVFLAYENLPQYEPENVQTQHAIAIGMFVVVLIGWFVARSDRQLSKRTLSAIEWAFVIVTGPHFGVQTYLNADRITPPLVLFIYASFAVMLRAILVPSTTRRTLLLAGATMAGWGVFAIAAVVQGRQASPEFPPSMMLPFIVLLCASITALSAAASHVIFDLQSKLDQTARAGSYNLGRKLGEGATGDVYEARHAAHLQPVAVKIMDGLSPDDTRRLGEILDVTSRLDHPGIVRVFDYGETPTKSFYYAMQLVDGIDLETLVREYGPLPVGRCVPILSQMCEALFTAHCQGVVHRDVKPANAILRRPPGARESIALVDFGVVQPVSPDSQLTSPDVVEGTPGYMAPEAITDPEDVGAQADVYSLGAVAYFLLTARTVFDGETVAEMCAQHIHNEPKPPSAHSDAPIPAAVDDIVVSCLAKKPEERPELPEICDQLAGVVTGDWAREIEDDWWRAFRLS